MRRGFLYLVAIMDWGTRKVLSRRLSNTKVDPGIRTACQGGFSVSFAVTQPLGVNDMGLELENAGFVDGFRSEYPA